MFRYALAAIGLLLSSPGWTQLTSRCIPYSPEATEVNEVLELITSEVPLSAELESACYIIVQRLTGGVELSSVRESALTFSWPTDDVVRGVRFYRKARCIRVGVGVPSCSDAGSYVAWMGSLTRYETNIAKVELIEVLEATEHLPSGVSAIESIERWYVSERGRRFAGVRRYGVISVEPEGHYMYTLERECSTAADCVWRVTARQRHVVVYWR